MRTRSMFTVLAFATVLAGTGVETAFADGGSGQATPVPSAPSTQTAVPSRDASASTAVPSAVATTPPATDRSAVPSAAPSTDARGNQITAVPSGAPNTGVPAPSNSHGETAVIGASLAALVGGSGTMVLRRKLKGRG
jgi:hypothetical protein